MSDLMFYVAIVAGQILSSGVFRCRPSCTLACLWCDQSLAGEAGPSWSPGVANTRGDLIHPCSHAMY